MNYIDPQISGWMGGEELQWLFAKAQEMDTIVEVGSWMGRSTHALCSGCKGIVYAVDHFKGNPSEIDGAHALAKTQDIEAIFKKNVGHFTNLVTMKMESKEAAACFKDGDVDMVFLDADHAYPAVMEIIEAWLPKCRKLLCGHDKSQDGTPRAFQELGLKPKDEVNQIWSIEI